MLQPRWEQRGGPRRLRSMQESWHGDEQTATRLRTKAQPASSQDHGAKALDETQSRDWRIYGSEDGRQVQIGGSGKGRRLARPIQNPFLMVGGRRFPPPWAVEETEECFIVGDADGQALAFCYFEEEPICRRRAKAAHAR